MYEIDIIVDTTHAEKVLNDVERRQVPFATALAMNNTMKMAQDDVRREYDRVFTQRNSSLARALTTIPRGEFATKRKLRVSMMNVRDARTGRMAGEGFVERQMAGTRKTPRGSEIAIPIIGKGMRRLKGGSIPTGKKAKNRTDLVRINNILFEKQRRGKKIVPRFVLAKSAKPSKAGRFRYTEVGVATITAEMQDQWVLAMNRALATAR